MEWVDLLGRNSIEAGLVECGCEGRTGMWRDGEVGGRVYRLTFEQPIIASGRMSTDEFEYLLELFEDPSFSFLSQITLAAWGRRLGP